MIGGSSFRFRLRDAVVQKLVALSGAEFEGQRHFSNQSAPSKGEERIQRRQLQHEIGRACAAELLAALGAPDTTVLASADRSPLWPAGFVGSITHSDDLVAAAVAPSAKVRGLGIDLEDVVADSVAGEIAAVCLNEKELGIGATLGIEHARFVTLCFSAKEALYKCLYPLVRTFFDFRDAEVVWIDIAAQAIRIRLLRDLDAEFKAGSMLEGRYRFADTYVLTSFELAPASVQ